MKLNNNIKTACYSISCRILRILIVLLAFQFCKSKTSETSSSTSSATSTSAATPNLGVGGLINHKSYKNSDSGFVISFDSDNEGYSGAMTITMPNACRAVYGYIVNGNEIEATYGGSDCNMTGGTQMLYYDTSDNSIYTYIEGQKFVYK
jgi:hypothetical protein